MSFPEYETSIPLLIYGGPIHVMDESANMPEALLVAGGKVVGHGTLRDLETKVGSAVRRLDTKGAVSIPGLIDTHPHLLHFAARSESFVDLSNAVDHDDIVRRIAAKAASDAAWRVDNDHSGGRALLLHQAFLSRSARAFTTEQACVGPGN